MKIRMESEEKRMKSKVRKTISVLLVLITMLQVGNISNVVVHATENKLNIYLGNNNVPRYHKGLTPGEDSEELSFELKGEDVQSSSYSSNNISCFKVVKNSDGKYVVRGIKEGTGLISLTVKTTNANTYTEKLFISVYTPQTNLDIITNKDTKVYMGASDNSGVNSYDEKGVIKDNTKLLMTAKCGDFYLIKTIDGTTFKGGRNTGFVKKSDIDIITKSLKIKEEDLSIKLNDKIKLNADILPDTIKDINWSSSNESVATTDKNGQVIAKSQGTVLISAYTTGAMGKEDSIYVSVYEHINSIKGYIKSKSFFYKVANDKIVLGQLEIGENVLIVGECDTYYRIKLLDSSLDGDYILNDYYYIPKENVFIHVDDIKLNESSVTLQAGEKIKLKPSITPELASNKKIKWTTSDKKVATVDTDGNIKGIKLGQAYITAETVDGNKKASCMINVEQNNNEVKVKYKHPTLKVETEGFDSFIMEVSSIKCFDGFDIYIDGKLFRTTNCPEKQQSCHGIIVPDMRINKKCIVKARTFVYDKHTGKRFINSIVMKKAYY